MSFSEVLRELPTLALNGRQWLFRSALDLDDPALSPANELLVEKRVAAHRKKPDTAMLLEWMQPRLPAQFKE